MRQVPLERDINIAVSGIFWVEVANSEHPFAEMVISHSRGTYLIGIELLGCPYAWRESFCGAKARLATPGAFSKKYRPY